MIRTVGSDQQLVDRYSVTQWTGDNCNELPKAKQFNIPIGRDNNSTILQSSSLSSPTMDYKISDLSPHLFWDVDRNKISWNIDAPYIINGIVEYGVFSDFKIMLKIYSRELIVEIIKQLRYLTPKTHQFLSLFFNQDEMEFRCYEQRFLNRKHWIY